MRTHITPATSSPTRRRRPFALVRRGAAATGLLALAGALIVAPAYATSATGGSGLYIGSIDWFQWGADGDAIPSAGMTKTNTRTVAGKNLVTTCTLSGMSGNLSAYRSGDWRGDAFDNLYNIGGADASNTLVAGLVTTDNAALVSFNFSCSVTYDGVAMPMAGLVFADAESSTATRGEYITATPSPAATWRIIDRTREASCATSTMATLTAGGSLTLAPDGNECSGLSSTGYGPAAVAFMQGATSAAVTLKGGGKTAVALGVVLESDYGDAPASYGAAGAFYQSGWTGGVVPVGTTNVFNGFTMATTTSPTTRLGATIDSEPSAHYSVGANGDGGDEDAITPPGTLSNVFAGTSYTLSNVACTAGYVRGWIDWNHNGVFDSGEASGTAACAGPSVSLTWSSIPADVTSASTYMRLRVANSSAEVASPTGMSLSGEVEDYPITVDAVDPIVASPDTDTTPQGVAVTVDPLTNDTADADFPLAASTVRVLDPADSTYKSSVTIPGEGTYTVHTDGTVTFAPVAAFTGTATPVTYRVSDSAGRTAMSTITIDVTPVAPVAANDTDTTAYETPVTVGVLGNDAGGDVAVPLDVTTVVLLDPADASYKTSVTIPGEGTYTAHPDGTVTFAPANGFFGPATPVEYKVADTNGSTATATITVTVDNPPAPAASPDTDTTPQGVPVTVNPLTNDTTAPHISFDATTVQLLDPADSTYKSSVTIPGEGTYTAHTDGTVTFTPVAAFTGTATPGGLPGELTPRAKQRPQPSPSRSPP